MAKYEVPDGHWDEDDEGDEDVDVEPRVEVNTHSIVVDERVDDQYIYCYRWRFAVKGRTLLGWSRSDIEHNGTEDYADDLTYPEIPVDVQRAVERELGLGPGDLDDHLDLPAHLRGDRDAE